MSITKEKKQELITKYKVSDTDTGSAEVQIAVLTERINRLTEHFRFNKKDYNSRRGFMILIGRRRRLLRYLHNTDIVSYNSIIKDLGLRHTGKAKQQNYK